LKKEKNKKKKKYKGRDNMEDTNLKEFTTNIIIWLVVVLVFGTMLTIVFINRFGSKEISINKKIEKQQELVILVISNETKNTNRIKEVLKKNELSYEIVNKDQEMYFEDFLDKLSLTEKDIVEPTLIYVQEEKPVAILVNVKDLDALNEFIEYNILSGKER